MPPNDWSAYYEGAGKQYNVDPRLLQAVIQTESSGNPNAVGAPTPYGQAQGAAQLLPSTAKALGVSNPKDPKQAIYGAAELLSQNLARYGNVSDAVKAYYGGTNQSNWGPQTSAYPAKVASHYSALGSSQEPSVMPQQQISDADLISALTGAPPSGPTQVPSAPAVAASPAPPPAPAPAQMSDADLIKALTAGATGSASGSKGTASAPSSGSPPSIWDKALAADQAVGAGMIQGGRDVVSSLDPVAQWLDKHVGSTTLGGLLPTADQAHANSVAARNTFNQKYGNSIPATGGRIVGDIAASAPVLAAGGGILGSVAKGAEAVPYLGRAAQFVAGASEANPLLRIAQGAVRGAGAGAAGTALVSSSSPEPIADQLRQGAEFGGILGAAMPAVSSAFRGAVNRVASPDINPLRADLANKAVNQFGIPLRWSQISAKPFAKYLDSVVGNMPLSGVGAQNEAQASAFSRAVASTFGEDANKLTPPVMAAARKRIGNVFDRVAANTAIQDAPQTVLAPIGHIINEAAQVLPEGEVSPLLKQLESIGSAIDPQTKTLSGNTYQALTRKGSPLDRAMGSANPNIRYYAGQIKNALDDGLQASASPSDLADLKQARMHWKNMRTVQDLASKAGIEGEISPQALLGAVKKSYKDMPYSGAGDIGDLANIGKEFLTQPPSSGTGERVALYELLRGGGRSLANVLKGAGEASVAGAGLVAPLHTAATLGGILATGRGIGSVLRSTSLRNALLDAAAKGAPEIFSPPAQQSLLGRFGIPAAAIARQELLNLPAPANVSNP